MGEGGMTLGEQIATALSAFSAPVTPWGAQDRNIVPRGAFHLVAGTDNGNLKGAGPQRSRYQLDFYANSQAEANGLASAAKVLLRAGMAVGQITDNPDNFEPDTRLYSASFDIAAWST